MPNTKHNLTKEKRDLSVIRRCFVLECLMPDVYCGDKFKCIGNKIALASSFGARNVSGASERAIVCVCAVCEVAFGTASVCTISAIATF